MHGVHEIPGSNPGTPTKIVIKFCCSLQKILSSSTIEKEYVPFYESHRMSPEHNAVHAHLQGLTAAEAARRLQQFGANRMYEPEKIRFFAIAWREVREPMILLLLVIGVLYSIWGGVRDALTIFVVIAALVSAEVFNEFRAKNAIASLQELSALRTKVIRDGAITTLEASAVVPGDILVLNAGSAVVADAILQESFAISADESALTGESFPVEKKTGGELFAGTTVVAGEGIAVVQKTGRATRMGNIALTLRQITPPRTTLQKAMRALSGKLVYIASFFAIIIPVIGILRDGNVHDMILIGLSLAFTTMPEELPIIITMVLGLGAYTLAKKNFLVKKLQSAEILGNATCIVTDKTGTITAEKMTISAVFPAAQRLHVIRDALNAVPPYSVSFIDASLQQAAAESGIALDGWTAVRQRDITNGQKTKSVLRRSADGDFLLFTSGAPEEILGYVAAVPAATRPALTAETAKGRRVIGIATKNISAGDAEKDFADLERDMDFSGLISFEDPPRPGVADTIASAHRAGIRTLMVTGDHPETAEYIARKVGILSSGIHAITGDALDTMQDQELWSVVKTASVFARTTAQHKYRIVQALQHNGDIVAVTGDGVNDVLALRAADIGIAMGKRGTDVAKEAAAIVLADDNYITIAQGIFEGRRFFDNLNKGLKYYLSVKAALILVFLFPVLLGVSLPLAPIQIIVMELFMDLAASTGFVAEPQEPDIYARPPRDPRKPLINGIFVADIAFKGGALFCAVIVAYFGVLLWGFSIAIAQTVAFAAWMFGHVGIAFVSRSDTRSAFTLGFLKNKIMDIWAVSAVVFLCIADYIPLVSKELFLVPLQPIVFALVLGEVFLLLGILEARKRTARKGIAKPHIMASA